MTDKHRSSVHRVYRPVFQSSFFLPRYWSTWLLLGILRLCVILPRRVTLTFGAGIGQLFYWFNRKRRHIAKVNLDLCFPERSRLERRQLLLAHFRRYGQSVVDMGLVWWSPARKLEKYVRVTGLGPYLDLVKQGKNIILITPHTVGMDMGGVIISQHCPVISMMKALRNPLLNWYIWCGRTRFGLALVLREHGLRPLVRGIRSQVTCYYIPDEDFGIRHSEFVPFFDIQTATITTLGRLAGLTNAVVIPCFTRLIAGSGRYEVLLSPPLQNFPGGDLIADATAMNRAFELGIRAAPEQYLWTLKWFKTRPEGEPCPYG